VTICTRNRKAILANAEVHRALAEYGEEGRERNIALGRYVITPDHIHFLVRGGLEFRVGMWVRGLKRVVAAAVTGGRGSLHGSKTSPPAARDGGSYTGLLNVWQRGFFDHVLRNAESYAQKWNYVRENPVRAGLVSKAEDWAFAGEILEIDRI